MSHKFTRHEIDSAKIQVLQEELAEVAQKVPNNELYKRAVSLLAGPDTDHIGDAKPKQDKPEVEKYDE